MSSSISGLSGVLQSQQVRQASSVVSSSVKNGGSSDSFGTVSGIDTGATSFISALESALAQIGVSATGDSSSMGSSSDADLQQNLGDFMKSLLEAMRPKDGMGSGEDMQAGNVSGSQVGMQQPPPPPGGSAPPPPNGKSGSGGMQKDLQALISQLSSSSDTSDSSTTDTNETTSDDSVSKLMETFQKLLESMGASSETTGTDQTSLVSFLKTLSQNLQNASFVGTIIDVPS